MTVFAVTALSSETMLAEKLNEFERALAKVDFLEIAIVTTLVVLVVLLRRVLARLVLSALFGLMSSLSVPMSQEVRESMEASVRVLIVSLAAIGAIRSLGLPGFLGDVSLDLVSSVLIIAVFSVFFHLSETIVSTISPRHAKRVRVEKGWATRVIQLTIVVLAIAALLGQWDIEIGTALTGVGVLGAGLALAAQDLTRNLIAGMSNISEERFETGDWVEVVGYVEGIIVRVDLRSTTILGFDRIPHYVPNAELGNAVVRNKTRRDHRRIYWKVPLVLDTTDGQLDEVLNELGRYLEDSGDFVVDDDILRLVHVAGMSDSSIDIVIYAFTVPNEYGPFSQVSDRLTREILRIVRAAGTDLAYPTQTLYVEGKSVRE